MQRGSLYILFSWSFCSVNSCFAVQGRVHTVGSSTVTAYSSVSDPVRVHRSTTCRFSRDPMKLVFRLKFVTSTTRVLPSQRPRESPYHWRNRIGLRVKLHDLHVLMAVVQAGNMSKAAALLNTTQPAISRSIAELERTIGVRLLERNPQGVEPTEYGRALLDGAVAVFDDLRQAAKKIEFLADPTAGEVRIGCTPILAASFVSA